MVRFSLRIPAVTYQAIVNQAHQEHRSVNQQIVAILEAATEAAWVAENHEHVDSTAAAEWEDTDQ